MTFIQNNTAPSVRFLNQLVDKVNAGDSEPRVIVEVDKMVFVPGMKTKFEALELVRNSTISKISTGTTISGMTIDYNNPGTLPEGAEKIITSLQEPKGITPGPGSGSPGSRTGDRFDFIKCAFETYRDQYGLLRQHYLLALAIAQHETDFGTLGQGRPVKGSFIVGYGCPGSCNFQYAGITTQAKFTMKRMAEALRSKRTAIMQGMTKSIVDYFHDGGDKGRSYVWSADGTNWKNRVWANYQAIAGDLNSGKWNCTNVGKIQFASKSLSTAHQVELEDDVYYNDGEVEYYIPPADLNVNRAQSGTDSSKMTFPIKGYTLGSGGTVTSKFWQENPSRPDHLGIDLSTNGSPRCAGKPIVAAYDGTVAYAGYHNSYGWHVKLEHYNGYGTLYAHMKQGLSVSTGQKVTAGQQLGLCGNTGNSYGAHLHFELYKGAWKGNKHSKINPRPYLEGAMLASANSYGSGDDAKTLEIVENIVFNKCFSKTDKSLPNKFVDLGASGYFETVDNKSKKNVAVYGFKAGKVPAKNFDGLTFRHKFSADGYFQPKMFINLKAGDKAKLKVDGYLYKEFTSANNGIIELEPSYIQYSNVTVSSPNGNVMSSDSLNEHVFDLFVESESGMAEVGYMCIKLVEVENAVIGYDGITYRTKADWIETGAMMFDRTFYLESDVMSWDVNNHFDMASATARITLDNSSRIYSPTYEYSSNFPRNLIDTEMSYYEYGERRHVLSEGTPIRIYAGYGDDMVRVFTGKITGEIEDNANNNTVTFNAVDMYTMVENHILMKPTSYPEVTVKQLGSTPADISKQVATSWVMSSIVHNLANLAGMSGWRVVEDDWRFPDIVVEESYYIDIDRGGKKAIVWDSKVQKYVEKNIQTIKTIDGFKNPYVMNIAFEQGTKASDAIQQLIGETLYRAYCDRYGTFRLHRIDVANVTPKWEFTDTVNLQSLSTSTDYTRTRNHLMILGSQGNTDHFVDQDLLIATKGLIRSAQVDVPWIDETNGANAKGVKKELADRLFSDMKRQSRTFNVVVKGNPLIDVLDGCYVYSEDTSTNGYYVIKGHRLSGNTGAMESSLELTWQLFEGYSNEL